MVVNGTGGFDLPKADAYRAAVNQPPIDPAANLTQLNQQFCVYMLNIGAPYIQNYASFFMVKNSPLASGNAVCMTHFNWQNVSKRLYHQMQ